MKVNEDTRRFVLGRLLGAGLFLLVGVGFWFGLWLWVKSLYYLPPEHRVRQQFESHKADYIEFVSILQKDKSARHIGYDGKVHIDFGEDGKFNIDPTHDRLVPEYRDLIRKIGAKFVNVGKDGAMEFALWGFGCVICSDSYMGVLYSPKDVLLPTVVTSLANDKLPQYNGSVASGHYVVPIEPEWFIYRFEYQE